MNILIVLTIIVALCSRESNACQSCLADLSRGLLLGSNPRTGNHNHHDRNINDHDEKKHQHFSTALSSAVPIAIRKPILNGRGFGKGVDASVLGYLSLRKYIAAAASNDRAPDNKYITMQQKHNTLLHQKRGESKWLRILFARESEGVSKEKEEEEDTATKANESDNEVMSSSMIMTIGFYKKFISPLLPPACRFLPTCSQYGVQAIEKYGPQKGLILTAWRLARCSPFGGRGYDPPIWPPVPYTYGSY